MKEKIIKILKYLGQIILTALASAGIALLQQWIEQHGIQTGATLDTKNTSLVGGTVASIKIMWNHYKGSLIA